MSDTLPTMIDVAIPCPLYQGFTYKSPAPIAPGTRVLVPFGARQVIGVVLGINTLPLNPDIHYLPIRQVIDEEPIFSQVLQDLGKWMANYYFHPIGEVFASMLPASKSIKTKELFKLGPKGEKIQELFAEGETLPRLILKKRLKAWGEQSGKEIELKDLVKKGWITVSRSKVPTAFAAETKPKDPKTQAEPTIPAKNPTEEQKAALKFIQEQLSSAEDRKPILLHGVTGSGKTEIYLQIIAALVKLKSTAQTLILVPEISLTPQMTQIFTQRFPQGVAVVHSQMGDKKRWEELNKIRSGRAQILIGPRSAVFAPFKELGLIIVDEEHDLSYKQGSGLMYQGRDVAIMRAFQEKALILLGSATPSLESFHNAQMEKYHYLALRERATGKPMPHIGFVKSPTKQVILNVRETPDELSAPYQSDEKIPPIAPEILEALRENLAKSEQSIVLVNRRGFAFYLLDTKTKETVTCQSCSISLTLHKRRQTLKCHYCGFETSLRELLGSQSGKQFLAVGFGSQQAEDYIRQALPEARLARLDSDVTTQKDQLHKTLEAFKKRELDILVGTQILAKGHDFPGVTLTVLCDCDQSLNLPDFRAGERTFQLLVQAAGRSGRGEIPGQVLLQSRNPDHPIIRYGLTHNFLDFARSELALRKAHAYPPFAKMVHIECNSESSQALEILSQGINQWLWRIKETSPQLLAHCKIIGPTVPPIEMIRGRFRRTILVHAPNHNAYRPWLKSFWETFGKQAGQVRILIDIDPQNLL